MIQVTLSKTTAEGWPTNDEIAGALEETASLLEAQGANPFRVGAYRKGAETVRGLCDLAGWEYRQDKTRQDNATAIGVAAMNKQSPFNSLLVPTDFSEASREAFDWAVRSIDGNESVIIVLHVLDELLIETIASHEFAARDEVVRRMRQSAEKQLAEYKESAGAEVEIDAIVSEGLPFLEIVRKANDFAVDAIVMGRVGTRGHFEKLLFGSTAEKVLRGASRPIIVLPTSND